MHVCMFVCLFVCLFVCVCKHTYVYIYIYIYGFEYEMNTVSKEPERLTSLNTKASVHCQYMSSEQIAEAQAAA